MPIAATLAKIEEEIAQGRLGIARDRLHGLIQTYPDDLSLRARLADVYWRLGYPVPAGAYWFLEPDPGEHGPEAIRAFLKDCNDDPKVVLKRLRLRGGPEATGSVFAKQRIEVLIEEYRQRYDEEPEFPIPRARSGTYGNRACVASALGCALVVVMVIGLAVFGLIEFLKH